MSAHSRAPARHRAPGGLRRAGILAPLVVALAVVAAGVASAEPLPAVAALTAVDAARSGLAIGLVRHPELAPGLIEVQPAAGAPPGRVLAVAPDGAMVAVADRIDLAKATLSLAREDGSQLRVPMPGLLAAAFAPDGSWLAVIDGAGSLWSVITASAAATRLADGPFLGPVTVEPAGTVLLAAVSSVEAPVISRLVRLDPAAGSLSTLSEDRLVYGSTVLADGSIAVVAHEPRGTVVNLVTTTGTTRLADLGPGAIHVSVSPDGGRVAWERTGDGVYLLDSAAGRARRIAAGSNPRLSADGRSLLVLDGDETLLLGLDGSRLAQFSGPAAFAGCGWECRP
jgi:hypothetical protein